MSYLEHEQGLENCGCPSCDLTDVYLKAYDAYKSRKPYRAIEIRDDTVISNKLENDLNKMNAEGYEITSVVIRNCVVMRSVPPLPPSNADVIQEFKRRKEETSNGPSSIDEWQNFKPIGEA